jgi:hypothetical protein
MNKLFVGIFSLVLATLVLSTVIPAGLADVAVGEGGVGAEPGDQDPRICVKHRDVHIGMDANPPGINPFDYRTGLYAFTGEQLELTVAVRDPNGALDIGFPKIRVGGAPEVLCNEIPFEEAISADKVCVKWACSYYGCKCIKWADKDDWPWQDECDGMGDLNEETDRLYHCLMTVEPTCEGEREVKVTAYNSAFEPTDGTHVETWHFNPALSLSVKTSDGMPIHFEDMPYMADTPEERTVHSLNRLQVQNTAEGGVNMWMYLAGTDLFDPSGASKCPETNVLEIEKYMQYRGWTGTMWTSSEGWEYMGKYNQNDDCTIGSCFDGEPHCYGGKPVPYPNTKNVFNPMENVLTNQGKLEVEFKLTYPMPCVGSFSHGSIMVFGKAI